MRQIIRIVGTAFGLSLLFLAAMVFTLVWMQRQNNRLLADAVRSQSAQFAEILALTQAGPPPWSEKFTRNLGRAVGGEITIHATPSPEAAPAPRDGAGSRWHFDHTFAPEEGRPVAVARVSMPMPASVRAVTLLHRITALLVTLALILLLVLLLLVLLDRRWLREPIETGNQAARSPADYRMISHLAERSARQSAELEQEREERQNAEADAHLKQILLNRALQEKIDMGRDLHDGLIQSLYATGLTIQAGRKALDVDPALAREQIDNSLQTLNTAIREVRTYISGLGPEQLQQRSFAESVAAIVENLSAVREIATDLRIDEEAAAHLSTTQTTDLLQIVREAVSNALRHGHARKIAVRLHRNGDELCLFVHDDGRGFDADRITRGHGLDNMRARADRLGAQLRCASEPGQGTRLVINFHAPIA